jgi:mannose-6-phosphate isomerase
LGPDLPPSFGGSTSSPIGEVWFEHPDARDLPLLVKYIFTSEKLSVQVHPNDEEARERGLPRGKDECWYILDAEPGATLGLGLRSTTSADVLRLAAIDGSIEQLMDWRPVTPGDFFYVPAGTIHAIGAGITLLEVQQNSDVTYRLYDYGRPRELHLEDGVAVAKPAEYPDINVRRAGGPLEAELVESPYFSLVRVSSADQIHLAMTARQKWIIPLQGQVTANGETAAAGECMLLPPGMEFSFSSQALVLIATE